MIVLILLFAVADALIYGARDRSEASVLFSNPLAPQGTAPGVTNATRDRASQAELDDSDDLPGRYVPSQGRQHIGAYPREFVPFCDGGEVTAQCYASNPPTSGLHVPVQRNAPLPDGHRINLPPDPNVYPFEIPRESIPHLEEHAGVFVGYNCASDACRTTVERVADLVSEELSLGARVVMAPDTDLDPDTIGLAAWTRVDVLDASEYTDERVRNFIKAHSCRFDPEGFCPQTPLN